MSRRKARQHKLDRRRSTRPLRHWTIQRASGLGVLCGLAALLIAGLFSTSRGGLLYPYAALLGVTALCGASILWITAFDIRDRGTSGRMRPIRGFDLALGLALLAPSLYAPAVIRRALGL